jgi:hypothetical protein
LLSSIDDFFNGIAVAMGKERFTNKASLHLSAPGWQALGVIHYDIVFRLKLDAAEREKVINRIASIEWQRSNPEWVARGVAHVEIDKKNGQPVMDENGQPKIVLSGAGRTNTQAIIDVVREKAGIATLLPANAAEDDGAEAA